MKSLSFQDLIILGLICVVSPPTDVVKNNGRENCKEGGNLRHASSTGAADLTRTLIPVSLHQFVVYYLRRKDRGRPFWFQAVTQIDVWNSPVMVMQIESPIVVRIYHLQSGA
ncbi:hypothetical protein Hanom_Chr07g00664371 [Helianthus anomalus]